MPADPAEIGRELVSLRRRLNGRAAGAWRVDGDRLVQLAFDAEDDMPADVVARFAAATVSVPLDRGDLGIVAAVIEGGRRVSRAVELPADAGSGYWLRAFEADRSVAVPIREETKGVLGVISVALIGAGDSDDEVERILHERALPWFRPD